MVDLHIHTTHSDGELTPNEVVQYAVRKNLVAIAITDHYSITGVSEAVIAGDALGIKVISGIELSSTYEESSIHVVGLMIDIKNDHLNFMLDLHAKAMEERLIKTFANLISLGIENISYDEFRTLGPPIFGHFMRYMISKKTVKNFKELKKYVGREGKAYVPYSIEALTVSEAIVAIHKAGGIAIWAHPFLPKPSHEELEHTLVTFKAMGLDGIEAYYPEHTQSDYEFIARLANNYNLAVSGGSDFHGGTHAYDLGEGLRGSSIPYSVLEDICIYKARNDRRNAK